MGTARKFSKFFYRISTKLISGIMMTILFFTYAGVQLPAYASTFSLDRFNMSYIYFGSSTSYTEDVDATKHSLDDISPSYFNLEQDGSLKLTVAVDRSFVDAMHQRGVRVTPFLSNHWDRQTGINALANRELLTDQIASAIAEYDLDGVDIDIENVTEAQRDSYTDLVRLLRQKLPAGKSLSVAVAPNPHHYATGWYGSYDYARLAQYSDYLMLMAYDEHYQGGDPGAVAGAPFVEQSVRAALEQVPADKLVLGIAFYGRLWKQGASYGGYGISNATVEELIGKYRGKVVYDTASKSPKATITILSSDHKPVIFGRALDAGKYDIWYENEQSIKTKLALVEKYDLKGTGSWSLGQETADTWDYYSMWLNGIYFADVQSSWAKSSILSMMQKGWMLGVSGTSFQPDAPVTRAQAVITLVRALGLDGAGQQQGSTDQQGSGAFSDTAGHWASADIETAREYGLVEGLGDGTFGPDRVLTRAQMAVLLDRVLKLAESAQASGNNGGSQTAIFPDVTSASAAWAYPAVNTIAAVGILQGYPDGNFHPNDSMLRSQLAALLDRAAPKISGGAVVAMR